MVRVWCAVAKKVCLYEDFVMVKFAGVQLVFLFGGVVKEEIVGK